MPRTQPQTIQLASVPHGRLAIEVCLVHVLARLSVGGLFNTYSSRLCCLVLSSGEILQEPNAQLNSEFFRPTNPRMLICLSHSKEAVHVAHTCD